MKTPFGFKLLRVADLPALEYPRTGDPRTRDRKGNLLYTNIMEPLFIKREFVRAEHKKVPSAQSPVKGGRWVYWQYKQHGAGFSGMTLDVARSAFVLVED